MKASKVIKALGALCFVLITVALIVIRDSPATGWEPSIYKETPVLAWVFLAVSITCGAGIAVQQLFKKERGNLWGIGFTLVFSVITIVLALTILRGYHWWGLNGDSGGHLGNAQDLIATGARRHDVYPLTPIYLGTLSLVTSLNLGTLFLWVPFVLGLLYIVSIYPFARSVVPHGPGAVLATLAAMSLLQGWFLALYPNGLANLLFPTALYLLVKSFHPGTVQWKALFLVMVFLLPPFHPVAGWGLLIFLLTIWLPERVWRPAGRDTAEATPVFHISISAVLIFVWFTTWVSSFYVWDSTIRNVHALIIEGGQTHIQALMGRIQYAEGLGYSATQQFFKVYTGILLYGLLALAALPVLLRRSEARNHYHASPLALYGPLGLIALTIGVNYFLNLFFGPGRMMVYAILVTFVLAGVTFAKLIDWSTSRAGWLARAAPFLVAIFFLGTYFNGVSLLYASPYTLGQSHQNTQAELQGADWFFDANDRSITPIGSNLALPRFQAFLLTLEERQKGLGRFEDFGGDTLTPVHFGYDKYYAMGQGYRGDRYMIFSERLRRLYVDVFPELADLRLAPRDFVRLEADPSVDRLYYNGDLELYFIRGSL